MLIVFLYVFIIAYYIFTWRVNPDYSVSIPQKIEEVQVTIIIPFKNEAKHLPILLKNLSSQDYSSCNVQYLFVNDNSTDESLDLIRTYPQFDLINSTGSGKKQALISALQHAKGELIISLDADCQIGLLWLSTILAFYNQHHHDLIILPVGMADDESLWGRMQSVEFQSVVASTASAALAGRPIMCNAANLAYKKSLIGDVDSTFKTDYASGDDMFLLEYAKRKKASIGYLKHTSALATIQAESWSKFWRQRTRWTSKSSGYRDWEIILTAAVVLLVNVYLLVMPFVNIQTAVYALLIKGGVDVIFLYLSSSFWQTRKYVWLSLVITPLYPIYVLCAVVGGLFTRKW